jgi:hypothetical protein
MDMLQHRTSLLTGLGVGAGLMYFLDPDRGRRRRALLRDQMVHSAHVGADAMGATRRDVAHRAAGVMARIRGAVKRAPVDDVVLSDRVRAQLGRFVSRPHAIDVAVSGGIVALSGPVLEAEAPRLIAAIERVRGVREVVNALDAHAEAGDVPALQGRGPAGGTRPAIRQRAWSPTTRLLVGTAAATGVGLLARAASTGSRHPGH